MFGFRVRGNLAAEIAHGVSVSISNLAVLSLVDSKGTGSGGRSSYSLSNFDRTSCSESGTSLSLGGSQPPIGVASIGYILRSDINHTLVD